jgi:hypothetical protein
MFELFMKNVLNKYKKILYFCKIIENISIKKISNILISFKNTYSFFMI